MSLVSFSLPVSEAGPDRTPRDYHVARVPSAGDNVGLADSGRQYRVVAVTLLATRDPGGSGPVAVVLLGNL